MIKTPTDRQLAVLKAIDGEGGYAATIADCECAEQCSAAEWVLAEGATGYALTVEGAIALRAATKSAMQARVALPCQGCQGKAGMLHSAGDTE